MNSVLKLEVFGRVSGVLIRSQYLKMFPVFAITKCIMHDPLHMSLEGVDRVLMKWLLYQFIAMPNVPHFLTLEDLNTAIVIIHTVKLMHLTNQRLLKEANRWLMVLHLSQ